MIRRYFVFFKIKFYIRRMENIILKFIGQNIKGVDTYQHNDSTWLIFTDEKKWVIELTKDGTLWYNYNFFNSIFSFFSLDVIENQHYITKWVEDTIQNGVKRTNKHSLYYLNSVEDTIQKGVRNTVDWQWGDGSGVEDDIQNGVRNTRNNRFEVLFLVEDAIQNGIKNTEPGGYLGPITIRGKVFHQFESSNQTDNVGNVIQNGVKETKAMDEAVFQGEKY